MIEAVKNARLTKAETALVLGIDLLKPEGREKWDALMAKVKKYGIGEEYGKGVGRRYSYENIKRMKQLLALGNTPPPRMELVNAVKEQLKNDGY